MNWTEVPGRAWQALVGFYAPGIVVGLVIAFFVAGALNVFVPKSIILRYLGRNSNKLVAYSVAILAGIVISV